ncbi:MAG: MarR family transcriptional regulator [bacterium]|nr:MarR family transcriptional regulator [bacterium]
MDKAEELRYLILAVQREGNRLLTEALRPLDLTPSQAEVLQVLEQFEPLSLLELGERLVCETGSPSRLVNSMVEKGLIQKATSEADRRAVQLVLSDRARQIMPELNAIQAEFNKLPLGVLDEATLDLTVEVLWRFAETTSGGQALRHRQQQKETG